MGWDERERRTSKLIRACYATYVAAREPTAEQLYALCKLTWLSKGKGGDLTDNTAAVVAPAFSLLTGREFTATSRAELVQELVAIDAPELIVSLAAEPVGFVNYYTGFRNIAKVWLENHHGEVCPIVTAVIQAKRDADASEAYGMIDHLPPLPRPGAGDGKPRSLLTPLLACLDQRGGRAPIINERKVWLLKKLHLASASLRDQHDGLVNLINQVGIRDAFDLDVADEEKIDAALRSPARGPWRGPGSKPMGERCDDDVEYMHRTDLVTMRHRHNAITNALRTICEAAGLSVEEGSDQTCLYDALLRSYSGTERHLLIEVKTDDAPPMCRMAVGQLLDYRRQLSDRAAIDLAVLFPAKPSAAARTFLNYVGVSALWLDDEMRRVLGDIRIGGDASGSPRS